MKITRKEWEKRLPEEKGRNGKLTVMEDFRNMIRDEHLDILSEMEFEINFVNIEDYPFHFVNMIEDYPFLITIKQGK